jgi:hypothetical protein
MTDPAAGQTLLAVDPRNAAPDKTYRSTPVSFWPK